MGRQAQAAMAARTPRIASAEIQGYVSQIGHRLAASAGGPRLCLHVRRRESGRGERVGAARRPCLGVSRRPCDRALRVGARRRSRSRSGARRRAASPRSRRRRRWWPVSVSSCSARCSATPAGPYVRAGGECADRQRLSELLTRGRTRRGRRGDADPAEGRMGSCTGSRRSSRPRAPRRERIPRRSTCSSRRIRRRTIASRRFVARTRRTARCGRDSAAFAAMKKRLAALPPPPKAIDGRPTSVTCSADLQACARRFHNGHESRYKRRDRPATTRRRRGRRSNRRASARTMRVRRGRRRRSPARAAGTSAYSVATFDMPPPRTMTSGSSRLTTVARPRARRST